ncbi:MAG: transglutaminase-like domain-containing protein [Clostridia bacterium]|nr:transglutaminase-like domain-containing protein [Clostridia bacterium]
MFINKIRFILILSLTLMLVFSSVALSSTANAAFDSPSVDESNASKGVIRVDFSPKTSARHILRIQKENLYYDFELSKKAQYPLYMGSGKYSVLVAEQTEGTKYKVVFKKEVFVPRIDEQQLFLQSVPYICWNQNSALEAKAKALTKNCSSDLDKVKAIYSYITSNFKYDFEKAKAVKPGYVPDLEAVLASSGGICFDYSSVFAAMLRISGVPSKLATGYNTDDLKTYHAWNEVYVKELRKWVTIDSTYDSILLGSGQKPVMLKDPLKYKTIKVY